jgi:hypothetical protein
MMRLRLLVWIPAIVILAGAGIAAPDAARQEAMRAAIHPVSDTAMMHAWLSHVPLTRDFPDDLAATLRAQDKAWIVEMTTAPGCLPCGDLWARLERLGRTYGWPVRTIGEQEAMVRSGKLGLPWVGHPVAWVRSSADPDRYVPIAIGTDHDANLARNLYLAAKMLAGVRPAVGVRAMSKFTGIVGRPNRRTARGDVRP